MPTRVAAQLELNVRAADRSDARHSTWDQLSGAAVQKTPSELGAGGDLAKLIRALRFSGSFEDIEAAAPWPSARLGFATELRRVRPRGEPT